MTVQDPFHYPRPALAEVFLSSFASGISSAKTLFAQRQMGKTQFITRDLAPAAVKNGYMVIYCDFWGNEKNPAMALLRAIESAGGSGSLLSRIYRLGHTPVSSVEWSGAGFRAGFKPVDTDISEDQLQQIFEAIQSLSHKNEKVMILLDEVQVLALDKKFGLLVKTLRTVFEAEKNHVKVVYTGSSREGLIRLFKHQKSALFKAASQIELPQLDINFVRHELSAYKLATGRQLSEARAWKAFQSLHYSPRDFRELLEICMVNAIEANQFRSIIESYCQEKESDNSFDQLFESLSDLDKKLLTRLADDPHVSLYSAEVKTTVAEELGLDLLADHTIQNSLRRLRTKGILVQLEQGYDFEEPYFRRWIKDEKVSW